MKYFIIEKGQQEGPYSIEQLRMKNITPDTHVWCEGMSQWDRAKNVPELSELFQAPSTPPPSPFESRTFNAQPTKPCPNNHLGLAIFSTVMSFFCCGLPIGIIALIYALEVESKWKQGQYDKALSSARNARLWGFISIIAACSSFIFIFLYIIVIVGLEAFLMAL